jgi:OOP family OmpA-OmpF porin
VRWSALVVAALALTGCTQSYMREGRIAGLREIALKAREQGAYRCAPQELALAETHLEFAANDLAQGDAARAEEHMTLGEANARAALNLSPEKECKNPKPGDRDQDGIPDSDDRCPDRAEDLDSVEDGDGCPEDQDTDGDQLSDALDLCVASPEDFDNFLDDDGCPEEDNDVDGRPDVADKCPNEAEDPDGFQDDDGCPDRNNDGDTLSDTDDACPNELGQPEQRGCPKVYKDVVVTDSAVVITQQVNFATNKAVISPVSFALLDTVAAALTDFPLIRVEVQGHTDDRGSDKKNLKLSQSRAQAVRDYLIAKGIEPFRMTAQGYGESRPIETNKTSDGRAANRRVEFVRTDENARKPGAEKPGRDPETGAP